jgi:hypothetical protein
MVRALVAHEKEREMLRARQLRFLALIALWQLVIGGFAAAAPPWAKLVPFKKVDADPKADYDLEEKNGPWMIMAASFAGATAEQQSRDLVLELRQRFRLEAYTFRHTFDFTKPTEGLGFSRYGGKRQMRYANGHKFEEIAVIVGNFGSFEDPQLEKTLDLLKHAKPDTLDPAKKPDSSQRLLGLRTLYHMMSSNPSERQKGPMGAAFVTKNPLLPGELFVAKGIDPFVVEMNKDLPNSLLKCSKRYTVRVASFRGVDTMKPAEFEKLTMQPRKMSKIDQAALNASRLCAALREKGVEAYEFHDRTESIVTVGSFDEIGPKRPDGKTELNPAIHRIMQQYGPVEQPKPGTNEIELYARTLNGIRFDPQPEPVEIPRQSIATAYNATNSLLRQ